MTDDERAFDVTQWVNTLNLADETSRNQARAGFHAGYDWAAANDLGTATESEQDAYSAGEGHFSNGFDQGKDVYESDDYPGGVEN